MFKFILVTLVVLFIFGKVFKYAFKYLLISKMAQQKYSSEDRNHTNKTSNRTEPSKKKNISDSGGEYIDYEIIK